MKVQLRNVNGLSILDCFGDIDLYSSTRLRTALLKEIQSNRSGVLVNMAEVSYIDSSGIATLVEGLQLSRQTKTRLGLFGLRNNARSVLELARLDKVFHLFSDEKEALQKIPSTEPFAGL
jgi:anti-sigma B factor antagonist